MFNFLKKRASTYFTNVIGICVILYSLFLSSSAVRYGDLGFNTDLARDFLLLENIQETHKLTLLGPRSGGIPGLFHGPLWMYINLPAYFLGHGNPVAVGWFWVGLIAVLIGITYWVGKSLINHTVGLLAALLVGLNTVPMAPQLFNPFGAVIFSPLFFYFFYKYFTEAKARYLLIALLINGVIIQFQVAFGGPMLFLATIIVVYRCFKKKQLKHLYTYFILLIPLSTYIFFDLRHNFLELHSIIIYLQGKSGKVNDFYFNDFIYNRFSGMINSLIPIASPSIYIIILILGLFGYLIYYSLKNKKEKYSQFILLFFYFFFGYWLITLFFRGVIWSYYYWPFIPIELLIVTISIKKINKFLYTGIILVTFILTLQTAQASANVYTPATVGKDGSSWLFNYNLAQTVFDQGDKAFGYYIFSPDQYGYSPRYAMNYVAKMHPTITVYPYQKETTTYLIISPPGGKDNSIGGDWWKLHRVNIKQQPNKVITFTNGFRIEKYIFSAKEKAIPSDPNLIDNLIFR